MISQRAVEGGRLQCSIGTFSLSESLAAEGRVQVQLELEGEVKGGVGRITTHVITCFGKP
jgi:hypothetical protein